MRVCQIIVSLKAQEIRCWSLKGINGLTPLHPNISIHILHTVLYTLPKVLTRRIC